MSNPNPYFDEGADDDLFASSAPATRHHLLDGHSVCPGCGLVHNIDLPGDKLPDEVLDQVSMFIDTLPEHGRNARIVVAEQSSPAAQLITDFESFSERMEEANAHGALLRALAEVVNDQTDGAVERRWRIYRCEQSVMVAHAIAATVTTIQNSLSTLVENYPRADREQFHRNLDSIVDMVTGRQEAAVDRYRSAAAEIDYPVDETLITEGYYAENPSALTKATMSGPYRRHHHHSAEDNEDNEDTDTSTD